MYSYSITVFNRHSKSKCVNFHISMDFVEVSHTFNDLYSIFDKKHYYFVIKEIF